MALFLTDLCKNLWVLDGFLQILHCLAKIATHLAFPEHLKNQDIARKRFFLWHV